MGFEANWCLSAVPTAGQFAADRHFLDQRGRGYASNDSSEGQSARAEPGESHRSYFSIYRAASVNVTSVLFAGGDWRWRLTDQEGAILVEAGGYRSEAHCRAAVAILRARAGRATVA